MDRVADPSPRQPFQGKAGHSVTNSSAPTLPASKITYSFLVQPMKTLCPRQYLA